MSKPSRIATWATSGTALKADPGVSKQAEGWAAEKPPVQYMNWWKNLVGQWVDYFDQEVDAMIANRKEYDAVVGATGTHASINAVMADVNILAGSKVLVIDPLSLTATQIIDKNDITIVFKPNVLISTVTSLVKGIQLDAERIRFIGGRFTGFSNGGDIALEVTANGKNCLISETMFFNNDIDLNDLGNNTVTNAIINEVA